MANDETIDEPFMPIPLSHLRALHTQYETLQTAEKKAFCGLESFFELSEDYKRDAVQRLKERGASEAQIENYEKAFQDQVRELNGEFQALASQRESFQRLLKHLLG